MRLSKDFNREEFACKCGCGFDTVDVELLLVLQDARNHFDSPITITSGCRCETHNKAVGGASNSQHLYGRAADFKVENAKPADVSHWLSTSYKEDVAIGLYHNRVHVDTRTNAGQFWHLSGHLAEL